MSQGQPTNLSGLTVNPFLDLRRTHPRGGAPRTFPTLRNLCGTCHPSGRPVLACGIFTYSLLDRKGQPVGRVGREQGRCVSTSGCWVDGQPHPTPYHLPHEGLLKFPEFASNASPCSCSCNILVLMLNFIPVTHWILSNGRTRISWDLLRLETMTPSFHLLMTSLAATLWDSIHLNEPYRVRSQQGRETPTSHPRLCGQAASRSTMKWQREHVSIKQAGHWIRQTVESSVGTR